MKDPKTRLAIPAVALLLVVGPGAAAAGGAVLPPGNSAATQYTEAIPTAGGDTKTDEAAHHRSPTKVLGNSNTRKLQEHGADGQAAAEAAAATAPAPVSAETEAEASDETKGEKTAGSGSNGTGKGDGDGQAGQQPRRAGAGGVEVSPTAAKLTNGSSGVGSAFEQATGLSTSGQSGMLLPLVILATILWSLAYLWRQRRQVD